MEVTTMTTVTLKFKSEEGTKKVQHEIERIKLYQFTDTIKIVKDILVEMNQDGSLKEFFETAFAENPEAVKDLKKLDEKAVEEMAAELDNRFLVKAVESFQTLAATLPDKAFQLLATLSGIKKEDLEQQDLFDVLDIFDAVVEVNDIEALVNRLKKSLGATINGLKFLQKRREATTA
jgi:hypothetical protein